MSVFAVFLVFLAIGVEFGVSQQCVPFYDAENKKDFETINSWYIMVSSFGQKLGNNSEKAMQELEREACQTKRPSMCLQFKRARDSKKTVPGLWTAECIAVTMYTSIFYQEYNKACAEKDWQPYLTYTYLLQSAVKKLARLHPIKESDLLYRGLKEKCGLIRPKQIFWKIFTSTSTSLEVALGFGKTTLLRFQQPPTRYGARIRDLSYKPEEEEVLLLPFESFDVLGKDTEVKEYVLVFRSSDKQRLLKP